MSETPPFEQNTAGGAAERALSTQDLARDLGGQVKGFKLGVKPAVWDPRLGTAKGQQWLLEQGVKCEDRRGFIYNQAAIEERVRRADSDVLTGCGWDAQAPFDENMQKLWEAVDAPPKQEWKRQQELLLGLVLGYPDSALGTYDRMLSLKKRGVPPVENLIRATRDRYVDRPEVQRALDRVQQIYKEEHDKVAPTNKPIDEDILFPHISKDVKFLYQTLYGLTTDQDQKEIDFLLSLRPKTIRAGAQGERVYLFMISKLPEYGRKKDAQDVRDLEARVHEAFKKAKNSTLLVARLGE